MRRKLSFAFGCALLVLAFAFYSLPARLLPRLVGSDVLQMSGVSGTLLNGHAARAIVTTSAGPLHLGSLRWRFRPQSLLTLEPAISLQSNWGSQRIELLVARDGSVTRLRQLDANLSAGLARQFAPVALDGRLNLVFDELSFADDQVIAAQGRVVWQDALWLAPRGARPLGTFAGEVTTTDAGDEPSIIELAVTTITGPVFATGNASLSATRYSTDILLSGGDRALDADIARAISLLASPEDNGYRLRLSGDLSTDL